MHPALDRDVRISDAGREEFTDGAYEKRIPWKNVPSSLFERVFQLFEDGILQDRIDDEY